MKTAVLKFERSRVERRQFDPDSIDILQTLDDLRADLQCIEKVIDAIERLAAVRMEEGAMVEAPRRKRANSKRRGLRLVPPPRLRR